MGYNSILKVIYVFIDTFFAQVHPLINAAILLLELLKTGFFRYFLHLEFPRLQKSENEYIYIVYYLPRGR